MYYFINLSYAIDKDSTGSFMQALDSKLSKEKKGAIGCMLLLVVGGIIGAVVFLLGGDDESGSPTMGPTAAPTIACEPVLLTPDGDNSEFERCALVAGDITIDDAFEGEINLLEYLPDLETVTGSIVLNANPAVTSLILSRQSNETNTRSVKTVRVEGSIDIRENIALESIDFGEFLEDIGTDLIVDNNNVLTAVSISGLKSVGNDVIFTSNDALPTAVLSSAEFIGGELDVSFNLALTASNN